MADARAAILGALRAARPTVTERPARPARPPLAGDPVALFRAQLEAAGGCLVDARDEPLADALRRLPALEQAARVHSGLAAMASRPAAVAGAEPADCAGLDVALVRAACGVAESGAVWHAPTDALERAAVLLAEHVAATLAEADLVERLHDLYAHVEVAGAGFGWLLCGPSKTADIEQALVLGAHGARAMTVVLHREHGIA